MNTDLLEPVVPTGRQHPYFRALILERAHAPARDMLRAVWSVFPNADHHFVKEFQTTHFDARIWELYVFAFGHYGNHAVSRPRDVPDFLFERNDARVWVEATTANPSEKYLDEFGAITTQEREHEVHHLIPIKLAGALTAKLRRKDWILPHVKGQPFVLAVANFAEDGPFRHSDSALYRYLYGVDHKVASASGSEVEIEQKVLTHHTHGTKQIPSGFFALADAENVSAVIFSNEGTLPKFKRMGFDRSTHSFLRIIRFGYCMDFDPTATLPDSFGYLVGDVPEEWAHGVHVFHNPTATTPVPRDFFKGIGTQHWLIDGVIDNEMREFSPLTSMTMVFEAPGGADSFEKTDDWFRAYAMREAARIHQAIREGKHLETSP